MLSGIFLQPLMNKPTPAYRTDGYCIQPEDTSTRA